MNNATVKLVYLSTLPNGSKFKLPDNDEEFTKLYGNESRVRIMYDKREISISEGKKPFSIAKQTDWSPYTEVIRIIDEVVMLNPETGEQI